MLSESLREIELARNGLKDSLVFDAFIGEFETIDSEKSVLWGTVEISRVIIAEQLAYLALIKIIAVIFVRIPDVLERLFVRGATRHRDVLTI